MISIRLRRGIDAEIRVPGSKYVANRVLPIAALAQGSSLLKNIPVNDDVKAFIKALQSFGVEVNKKEEGLEVVGSGGRLVTPREEINVENSGTLARFITSIASLAEGAVKINGSNRIKQRPVRELLKSLEDLGAKTQSENGFLPATIQGPIAGGSTSIEGSISSQYISSLLIASPYAERDVEIVVKGSMVSKHYVDMTLEAMKSFDVIVKREHYDKFIIKAGQRYKAKQVSLMGDWSSANYFFAAAALTKGRVKVANIDPEPRQEARFVDVLREMGCEVDKKENSVELVGKDLEGVEVDMSSMPDSVQTLAAVAPFAKGKTIIKNVSHLRHKESDRINDTVKELRKLNVNAKASNDGMVIEQSDVKPGTINPHNDHRMAMSLALIGLKADSIRIENEGCVSKSFPNYWKSLKEIGVEVKNE